MIFPSLNNFGVKDMTNLYRISFTSTTGHHVEDKPFKDQAAADTYAANEALACGCIHHRAVNLGEAVLLKVEVTDTFGGEANYSWVNRFEKWIIKDVSDRECVRVAKALAGWTGHNCTTENFGGKSGFTLRPRNLCQVMFINFDYDTEIA
jgi:hypothetical protein